MQKTDVYIENNNTSELNLYYRVNIVNYLILAFPWNININISENKIKEQLYKN